MWTNSTGLWIKPQGTYDLIRKNVERKQSMSSAGKFDQVRGIVYKNKDFKELKQRSAEPKSSQ